MSRREARSGRIRRRPRHFRSARTPRSEAMSGPQRSRADFSMNMPPEPDDPALHRADAARVCERRAPTSIRLLRYQGFGGSPTDRDAAVELARTARARSFAGAHFRRARRAWRDGRDLQHAGASPATPCSARRSPIPACASICAQLGLQLIGVEMDGDGVIPEALEEACAGMRRRRSISTLLYRIQRPSRSRSADAPRSARVARRLQLPIVEDDAYGFIPTHGPPPLAAIAPDSAGILRASPNASAPACAPAYVVAPDARAGWSFNSAMRGLCVMASPITAAIATRWIKDGTADIDPALHPFGKHRQRAHRREGLGAGLVSLRSAELQHLAADAQRLDPLGLREPGAVDAVLASFRATPSRPTARRPKPCASDWADLTRTQVERGLAFLSHLLERQPESVAT